MVSLSVSSCLCVFQLEEVTRQAETEKHLKEEEETKGNVGFLLKFVIFMFSTKSQAYFNPKISTSL